MRGRRRGRGRKGGGRSEGEEKGRREGEEKRRRGKVIKRGRDRKENKEGREQ